MQDHSEKLTSAFRFAMQMHQGETRKGSSRPYVYHPLAVAVLVLQYGGSEEQAQAAFVHDTIGKVSESELAERFGPEVARMAYGFSDPPTAADGSSWSDAKKSYLGKLKELDEKTLFVVACEELHELQELLHDLRYEGATVWKRYPAHSMEVFWYFRELLGIFNARLKQNALISEFAKAAGQLKAITMESATY